MPGAPAAPAAPASPLSPLSPLSPAGMPKSSAQLFESVAVGCEPAGSPCALTELNPSGHFVAALATARASGFDPCPAPCSRRKAARTAPAAAKPSRAFMVPPRCERREESTPLGGAGQDRLGLEQRAERLGLEQAPPSGFVEAELVEDSSRRLAPALGTGAPLGGQLGAQLAVAVGRLEDPPDDELRRRRAVPGVRLEPEGDVVRPDLPPAIELRAVAEGDRAPGGAALVERPEAEVLSLPHSLKVAQLAPGHEQCHARVAEPERRQAAELVGELERAGTAGNDRVDDERRRQVVVAEQRIGLGGERGGERVHAVGAD